MIIKKDLYFNLYNRVGNSVVIPMIEAIAEIVKEYFEEE